jgi:hypothetical protein
MKVGDMGQSEAFETRRELANVKVVCCDLERRTSRIDSINRPGESKQQPASGSLCGRETGMEVGTQSS